MGEQKNISEIKDKKFIDKELEIMESSVRLCNASMLIDSSFALGRQSDKMTKEEQLKYLDLKSRFNNRCICRELKIPGLPSLDQDKYWKNLMRRKIGKLITAYNPYYIRFCTEIKKVSSMYEYAPKPDKILTLDSFIEIAEAVDEKLKKLKNAPERIDKLKKIQGALYEILMKANEYDMMIKPDQRFQYETLINVKVIANQQPKLAYTTEMRSLIV